MEYKTKRNSDATVSITVKASAGEVEKAYQKTYEKARAKIKVPGFRPGKAPLELVEKQLGDSVADDAAHHLIADIFGEIAEKLDPPPISVPSFSISTFDRKQGAVYEGMYDTHPEVKLGKYKKIKQTVDTALVTEEDVDAEVEKLKKQHAVLKSKDKSPAEKGDYVIIDLVIRHGNKKLENRKDFSLHMLEENFSPLRWEEKIYGMLPGQSLSFEMELLEDGTEYAGKMAEFSILLKEAQTPEFPELNDDFAKEVGEHESLIDLRKAIKDRLQAQADDELGQRAKDNILAEIIKDSKYIIPESLVKRREEKILERMASRINRKTLTADELSGILRKSKADTAAEIREAAMSSLKRELTMREVIEKESIKAGREEIEAELLTVYKPYFSEDQIRSRIFSNENVIEQMESDLLTRKCLGWLYDHADIKKGKALSLSQIRSADAENEG